MQIEVLAGTRERIRERFDAVINSEPAYFGVQLLSLNRYLRAEPAAASILQDLCSRGSKERREADRLLARAENTEQVGPINPIRATPKSLAALAYSVLRGLSRHVFLGTRRDPGAFNRCVNHWLQCLKSTEDYSEFRNVYLRALAWHILDRLADDQLVLHYLHRYVLRVRSFEPHRQRLLSVLRSRPAPRTPKPRRTPRKREKLLLDDAVEFLFDQGVRVSREVHLTEKDIPDLVLQLGNEQYRFPVEAKHVASTHVKATLRDGMTQIRRYIEKAHSIGPVADGCLLAFNTARNVRLEFATSASSVFPYVRVGERRVYLIAVEVGIVGPASKQKLKTVTLPEDDIVS